MSYLGLFLSVLVLSCSCRKKILINSPPYPPRSVFFSVPVDQIRLINEGKLTISKLNNAGQIVRSKKVNLIITYKEYGSLFQIVDSWNEAQLFFNEGVNHLILDYGNQLIDKVMVKIAMNNVSNTINYISVQYNAKTIRPAKIIVSSVESSLYIIK